MLFNLGGVLDPDRLETVLRVTFPKMHEIEKRTEQAVPNKSWTPLNSRGR